MDGEEETGVEREIDFAADLLQMSADQELAANRLANERERLASYPLNTRSSFALYVSSCRPGHRGEPIDIHPISFLQL